MTTYKFAVINLMIYLILFSSGCTTVKPAALLPTEPGTRLKVETFGAADYTSVYGNEKVGGDALVGTAGGAAVGFGAGFISGLACGPFFVICAPVFALAGTGVGAVVGGVAGGVHGAVTSLPKEQAEQFNILLNRTFSDHDLASQLKLAFGDIADPVYSVVEQDSQIRVVLVIKKLLFEQHAKDELTLRMSISMQVVYGFREIDRTKPYAFNYSSLKFPVDHWLGNEGTNLVDEFHLAVHDLAGQTVQQLQHPTL
jgi:hypothetical protein